MDLLVIVYILIFVIFALIAFSVMQIRMAGIKRDFWGFIQANQLLDRLYVFSKRCSMMTPQEQIIFLSQAEEVFQAFDKIPPIIWEDEYRKYQEVLEAYKNIRVERWQKKEQTIK